MRFISVPVLESAEDVNGMIYSATFSPCDAMIIASKSSKGVKLLDIRQNSFRYTEFHKSAHIVIT